MFGTEAKKKLKHMPLSNDIIDSRINDTSRNILEKVITYLKASPVKVSIQLNDSTDAGFCSQLMAFDRNMEEKEEVEEF